MRIVYYGVESSPRDAGGYLNAVFDVQCPRHGKWIQISVSQLTVTHMIRDVQSYLESVAHTELPTKCLDCKEESERVALPASRWPNAGEPGGAEL